MNAQFGKAAKAVSPVGRVRKQKPWVRPRRSVSQITLCREILLITSVSMSGIRHLMESVGRSDGHISYVYKVSAHSLGRKGRISSASITNSMYTCLLRNKKQLVFPKAADWKTPSLS